MPLAIKSVIILDRYRSAWIDLAIDPFFGGYLTVRHQEVFERQSYNKFIILKSIKSSKMLVYH